MAAPDAMGIDGFVSAFYLNRGKRSPERERHVEQLIGERTVFTIANTLPPDIVEALHGFMNCQNIHWEFMKPYTEALPCAEGSVHEEEVGGDAVAQAAQAAPAVGPVIAEPDSADSSSDDEDD